jgi:type II secretory pathway component GspD/PulD (secretin)
VGVLMEATPEIVSLRPGVATLDITKLEVSAVSTFFTTKNVDRPVFAKSATKTKVTLADGETFVVGGLKTRRTEHNEDRVPILGDIPLLGLLFRSQMDIERNLDVLFFITPCILAPGENFLLPYDFKNQEALGVKTGLSDK